jgi:uncharacterized protein YecT (DUF1311 family)
VEHESVIEAARATFDPFSDVLRALDDADRAWRGYARADCAAVAADWEGGALQAGARADCLYRHTVARAQVLWERHLSGQDATIPAHCRLAH